MTITLDETETPRNLVSSGQRRVADWCEANGFDYATLATEPIGCCNLCGHSSWDVIALQDRYGLPVRSLMCLYCGLIQISPRMTAEGYEAFYRDGFYRSIARAFFDQPIEEKIPVNQRAYADVLKRLYGEHLEERRSGMLLDIGGSMGGIAAPLAEAYDLRATVLEPCANESADAPAGIAVEAGLLETWDAGGRTFDVVLLIQTIDHLLDVAGSLAKIRSLLAPGGIFIVDAVDVRAIAAGNRSLISALKLDHCYGLTAHTALAYLRRAGLKPVESSRNEHGTKWLWLCEASEPEADYLPDRRSVWEMHSILLAEYQL